MKISPKIVISASRRTDIPAFYLKWFHEGRERGVFEVENPFNRRIRRVPATPEAVHTFAFWSKNFGPFLEAGCGGVLQASGYHLFFNFSLNSEDLLLEPNLPPLSERLSQLELLCRFFGAESVTWRFDPICFYRMANGSLRDNLKDFNIIAQAVAECGITRCITSFLDIYSKVQRRAKRLRGIVFEDPPLEEKVRIIRNMSERLRSLGIRLSVCCEKEIVAAVADEGVLNSAACISNGLLMEFFGSRLSVKPDSGQRIKAGCGCSESVDIGSYSLHPCHHDCLFCYANPSCDGR